MAYYFFVILLILNLIITLMQKQSKFLAALLIIFDWILIVFSYNTIDYYNYNKSYLAGKINNSSEYGYQFLIHMSKALGWNFAVFRGALYSAILILLFLSYKRIKSNLNEIATFFSLYPFFLSAIQMRNALAMSILTFAIIYFLKDKHYIAYIISVVIAASIHASFYIYIVFALHPFIVKKRFQKGLLIFFACLLFAGTLLNGRNLPFLNTIIGTLNSDIENRANYWLNLNTRYGFVPYTLMAIFAICICGLKLKDPEYHQGQFDIIYDSNNPTINITELTYRLNIMNLFVVPLLLMSTTFARYISNLSFLNYLTWYDDYSSTPLFVTRKKVRADRLLMFVLICGYIFLGIYMDISGNFDERVLLFFKNNFFFQYLRI